MSQGALPKRFGIVPAWAFVALAFVLVAPTPGEVGGCGDDAFFAEAETFCRDQEAWECRRREARGEIEGAEVDTCFGVIPDLCASAGWPATCLPRPTTLQTDACIDALALRENVDVPILELAACRDICPAPEGDPGAEVSP